MLLLLLQILIVFVTYRVYVERHIAMSTCIINKHVSALFGVLCFQSLLQ